MLGFRNAAFLLQFLETGQGKTGTETVLQRIFAGRVLKAVCGAGS